MLDLQRQKNRFELILHTGVCYEEDERNAKFEGKSNYPGVPSPGLMAVVAAAAAAALRALWCEPLQLFLRYCFMVVVAGQSLIYPPSQGYCLRI